MPRIVTLTMNPALDIETRAASVAPEIKLRCEAPRFHPGGGGINVSRALHFLDGGSTAVYAAGGHSGAMLEGLLADEGIDGRRVDISGLTRENLVVYETSTGLQYRFTMPGPELRAAEWRACVEAVFALNPAYIVASGSLPPGAPSSFYGQLASRARARDTRLILDTAGDALAGAAGQNVFMIKPNLRELERFAGEKLDGEARIKAAGQRLIATGMARNLLVSLGAAGAALITAGEYLRLRAPIVPIQSKVGAGDSMVAGLVLGLATGRDIVDAARLGLACGSAAVMTAGTRLCRAEDAWRLYNEVVVTA